MSSILKNPQRTLTRLVWLNIAFDILTIPIWIALQLTSTSLSTSGLTVNTNAALIDAIVAVVVFAVALFGILGEQKWGVYLSVAGTVGQRVVGAFLYSLNIGMAVEIIWSLLIIFFAYKVLQQPKSAKLETNMSPTPKIQKTSSDDRLPNN